MLWVWVAKQGLRLVESKRAICEPRLVAIYSQDNMSTGRPS